MRALARQRPRLPLRAQAGRLVAGVMGGFTWRLQVRLKQRGLRCVFHVPANGGRAKPGVAMSFPARNTLATLGIAAVSMFATLALLSPRHADAEDEEVKTAENLRVIKPYIGEPSVEQDGCKLTLKIDKESYAAGEKPVVTLEISNTSGKALTRTFDVSMSGRNVEAMSRMPAMPRLLWEGSREVTLAAGETKTITFETGFALKDNESVAIRIGKEELLERPIRIRTEN